MLIGFEYVVSAYVIWVCTFAVYIIMTKRRMKIIGQSLESIKQRISASSDNPEKSVPIENQD
tara:strand:- start:177 stop:362 length:186 start_codon:yes stop_codon:yes gene_type:complete